MHATFEEIAADAMRLHPRDRVKLAQRLVSSLDPAVEKDVEGLWLIEAERRLEELRTGEATGIDAPEAFRKAHEALKK
jgi:putative addiction module component (TIGR02574 family)